MGLYQQVYRQSSQATPVDADQRATEQVREQIKQRLIAQSQPQPAANAAFRHRLAQLRQQGIPLRMQDFIDYMRRQVRLSQRAEQH